MMEGEGGLTPMLIVLLVWGCAHTPSPDPISGLPFAFEARPTSGEVRVVPALATHAPLEVNLDSYLGTTLSYERTLIRRERTAQLSGMAEAVGLALPGEVNGQLGLAWPGQFRAHPLPSTASHRLTEALRGRRMDLHAVLADAAKAVGGEATLFTWITELTGEPLSLQGFPGQVVETSVGPVVLDFDDEPYLVTALVGMALVTHDGEVVLRYQDTYDTILSAESDASGAGQSLARALVQEVVLVWATDPRLLEHEPPMRRSVRPSSPRSGLSRAD